MGLNVEDRGTGRPVVLLHGQPGQIHDWDRVIPALEADHRVVVPDRPGYGRSDGPALGLFAGADVLADDLRERGVHDAIAVGHSYGGGVALALADRHPDVVSALVLVASIGSAQAIDVADHVSALPVLGDVIAWFALHVASPWFLRVPIEVDVGSGSDLAALSRSRLAEKVELWRSREIWRSFVVEQRALIAERGELDDALGRIDQPAVVVTGDRDRLVRPAAARALAERLPNASLQVIPRAGHLLPYHRPDAIVDAIREMDARQDTGCSGSGR